MGDQVRVLGSWPHPGPALAIAGIEEGVDAMSVSVFVSFRVSDEDEFVFNYVLAAVPLEFLFLSSNRSSDLKAKYV